MLNTVRAMEKPSIEIFGVPGGKTARSISAERDFKSMSKMTYLPDDKRGMTLIELYNERKKYGQAT